MKTVVKRAVLLSAIVMFAASFALVGCEQFGSIPQGEYLSEARQSPQYDPDRQIFVNRRPDILDTMTVWQRFWADPFGSDEPNFLFNSNQTEPAAPLPEDRSPDFSVFKQSDTDLKFIWLGHSTLLVSLDGRTILIDPIFSDYASPFAGIARRFQPPALNIDELPPIDYIVISHDHYDHLDMDTIKYFIGEDISFLAPTGVGSHLRYWGIKDENITELNWWEGASLGGITFTATPSQHFSGRIGVIHNNKTLWASWVIQGQNRSLFFSGDSGYDTHYQEIGSKFGPFDVVFMENGQYDQGWKAVHNLPEEALKGFLELGGEYLVPIHWGMFNLAVHNWYDPPDEITRLAKDADVKLITPRFGQLVSTDNPPLFDQWWVPSKPAEQVSLQRQ